MIVAPRTEILKRLGFVCRGHIQNMSSSTKGLAASTSRVQNEQLSTVDSSQVEHHSRLSTDWWDLSGSVRALHSMNRLRVPFIRDGIIAAKKIDRSIAESAFPLKGIKIIDVGCGGGFLAEPLARLGAEVTGIDASSELISVARNHAKLDPQLENNPTYVQTTAEEHVMTHESYYDAVVASEVIEHVSDQSFFVTKCTELVKPGGSVFISTLNKTMVAWLGGIIAAEYVLGAVPKGTHDWNLFISPEEVQKLLEKCNCHTKLVHGMAYIPFLNVWCWSPTTSINYALHAVKSPR